MKTKVLIPLQLALTAMVGLSSCNSSGDTPSPNLYLDIVTIRHIGDEGCSFSAIAPNSDNSVTYTTSQVIKGELYKAGERVIINYTTENGRFESGPINIYAIAPTVGKGANISSTSAEEADSWATSMVKMYDIFRTGQYVNIVFLSYGAPTPKKCELVADETTLNDEYPTVHLIYEPGDGQQQSDYAFYMSYDMNDITDHEGCKGINVVYKGSGGTFTSKQVEYSYGFIKPDKPQ